jgi:glutamate-1-semialdehyde aminotransferase
MSHFEKDVFFFTTFGGEALSLAATIATINELKDKKVPQYLHEIGTKLKEGINKVISNYNLDNFIVCHGYPCRTILNLKPAIHNPLTVYAYIQQELLKHGILWSKFHNITYAFTEQDVNYTIKAYDQIFSTLMERITNDDFESFLIGKPLDVVFRKTSFNEK